MSRAALELERQVKEMRAKAEKERKRPKKATNEEVGVNDMDNGQGEGNELTSDVDSGKTLDTDLSQQGEAAGGNNAAGATNNGAEGKKKPAMAKSKKNGTGAAKKAAKPKAAKAPKAAKGERKPREKKVASGKLKKVEASGTTYLTLEFEEGSITLTPTGNREQNRDIAVKALRALL